MSDLICPFSATLARDDFACRHAEKIIRRGGAEFACRSSTLHTHCSQLFAALKNAALPAFNVEDDLLQVPHGVLAKIQFGGLLGLQRLVADSPGDTVEDIAALVEASIAHFGDIDAIPHQQLTGDITGYRLARRRRR
ncbi:MAG: hypothetical protein WBO34_10040 [Gammaproteobacteria bacterium]